MTRSDTHALISGGGIGGLTAALCLARAGWSVEVFEAASALKEMGAGLQLSPNAMKVFDRLGLSDDIAARGFSPEALELRLGRSGRRVFSVPVNQGADPAWGAPYIHIHRADLLDILADAARVNPAIEINLGTKTSGYETEDRSARLILGDGSKRIGQLLLGADGLHSTIREQMLGDVPARFTGNLAWRFTVPLADLVSPPPPTACVWAGPGRHAVTYRLRGGKLANFVGIVERRDWQGESWTEQGAKADALNDFEGWDDTVTGLIDAADAHFRWALFDRPPLETWCDGPVTLLGDACHPMLPFQAQGAAQAIEDAYVLASKVEAGSDISVALRRYEAARKPRASRIQAASRSNMKTFHKGSLPGQAATYGPMWIAGQFLPGVVRSRLDWIYGHDVTEMGL
ncbi:monooxygenase [Henriciella barbarensis]|uniref:Monooxygenase n=1 Tax=Henriciella barbarensis TaxID=86342 RepID=A0A399QW02_9PROT|nr:FAD-dependent monooxygenase [Henriciella barbarensis]RIJ22275.1 monooxygenase [Henriciella barbarensis]